MIQPSDGAELPAEMISEVKWDQENGNFLGKENDESQVRSVEAAECNMNDLILDAKDSAAASASQSGVVWTPQEDKIFETSLANFDDADEGRWQKLAEKLPGKDPDEIKRHYEILLEDIKGIESGLIQPSILNASDSSANSINQSSPGYEMSMPGTSGRTKDLPTMNGNQFSQKSSQQSPHQVMKQSPQSSQPLTAKSNASQSPLSQQVKPSEQERRKGIPWTEEEHRLFLLGLAKFGKGDWRSISRNYVISRTPTQVASHAQKYFIRLNSINKDKRRSSIHDITSINNGDSAQQNQGPITGQPSVSPPAIQHAAPGIPHPSPGVVPHGMYPQHVNHASAMNHAPPMNHGPVMNHAPAMNHAHGMPMMAMPPPGAHVGYPPRGHVARPVMPGAGMPMTHMGYVSPPAMHH